ncbi:MAG: PD-(D/E)XK nuclease family protein [bacterium]
MNDYKTNKNLPPESKEEYREQLTLYGLGVQQNYAKYFKNIKARLHYLHFDVMDEWEITDELLTTVTKKYADTILDIEDKKFHYNMGDKKCFEPKENVYCTYCEYYSLCPLWAHLKFDDEVVGSDLGPKTVKGLVDEYVALSKQESQAKNDKELIKVLLVEYLEKNNLLKLF